MNEEKLNKIREWSKNNPKLRNFLWYLFFPITIPLGRLSVWWIKWITFKMLDKAIKDKNDNHILQIAAQHLRNIAHINEWKSKVSKKWFSKTMRKHEKKMYEYAIQDKTRVSFDYFRTLIDIYLKYNIIGGGFMNTECNTVIRVD